MSVSSANIKDMAKKSLKNNYLKTFAAALILVFAWILCVNTAAVSGKVIGEIGAVLLSGLIGVFLVLPLFLGLLKYCWSIAFGVCDEPASVFYWFSKKRLYLRALRFTLHFVLKAVLWLAVFNIPSFLLYAFSKTFFFELFDIAPPIWTAGLGLYSIILRNLSFVAVFFVMLKYYMAPVLFIADSNANVDECMYNSSVISRKSSFDFIALIFSSAHYLIAALFILPMPFVLPYLLQYYVTHIRISVEEYNLHVENSKFQEAGFI